MISRSFRDATEPSPEAVDRLARAFSGRSTRSRLALLPDPRGAVALPLPRRPWPRLALALAAVAVAAVTAWSARPHPLQGRLEAAATVTEALTPEVAIQYSGTGAVSGTRDAPRIRWEVGTLRVEVEPGVQLSVETDEGVAAVLGTAFTVERGALGTTVTVERGRVALSCGELVLGPGEAHTCLPLRPAGLLARARALRADRALALDTVRRGLASSEPGDPARGELLALQVELLAATDPNAARAAARTYLREGYQARRAKMQRFLGEEL